MLFSPEIQPIIQTPGHGALPSGHATEAYALATVLTHLYGQAEGDAYLNLAWEEADAPSQRFKLAARIAINRTVAGVHFPIDSAAGCVLGVTLGEYLVARASEKAKLNRRTYEPRDADFMAADGAALIEAPLTVERTLVDGQVESSNLKKLWQRASEEARGRWGYEVNG